MKKLENVVFIDGISRAGKFWLANMLIHLDRMEHMQCLHTADLCTWFNLLGLLTDMSAVKLFQAEVDNHIHEITIGRNINFRLTDSSSIYKNPNLQEYLHRIYGGDIGHREIEERVNGSNRFYLFIIHEMLCNGKICFKAFPKAKIIRIERNPVDLVYAWYKKGHGKTIAEHRNLIEIVGKKRPQPCWAYNWEQEYQELCEMDRIIKSIATFIQMTKSTLDSLPEISKKRICFTSYEFIATQPRKEAQKISVFLNTKPLSSIELFFSDKIFQQRDRKTIKKSRTEKLLTIKNMATRKMFSLLLKLDKQYSKGGFDI